MIKKVAYEREMIIRVSGVEKGRRRERRERQRTLIIGREEG